MWVVATNRAATARNVSMCVKRSDAGRETASPGSDKWVWLVEGCTRKRVFDCAREEVKPGLMSSARPIGGNLRNLRTSVCVKKPLPVNLSSPEFLLGLGLGAGTFAFLGIFGWLWLRQGRDLFAARLRADLTAEHTDQLRGEAAARAAAETRAARLPELEATLFDLRFENSDLRARAAELDALLVAEKDARADGLRLLDDARAELSDAFRALSADALRANQTSFLALAETHLGRFHEAAAGDLERRQQAIDALVGPVRESLDKMGEHMVELERARTGAYEGLSAQVHSLLEVQHLLRGETNNLVNALRRPNVRGRWGEIQLRRVVELAGMLNYCDFMEQQGGALNDEGRGCGPTCSSACPAAKRSSWTPRLPSTRISTRPVTGRPRANALRICAATPDTSERTSTRSPARRIGISFHPRRSSWCCFCREKTSFPPRWSTTRR